MTTKYKLLTIFLFLIFITCQQNNTSTPAKVVPSTQETTPKDSRWEADDYRNANWHPEKGQYFFSELWTWVYSNDLVEEEANSKGKMSIYIDPSSGTFLLTR